MTPEIQRPTAYQNEDFRILEDRLWRAVAFGLVLAHSDGGILTFEGLEMAERYYRLMSHFARGGYPDAATEEEVRAGVPGAAR